MANYQTAQSTPQAKTAPHRLTLDERKKLTVSGIVEVVSFDESGVLLKTVRGALHISGSELRLRALTPDAGQVEVDGQIDAMTYTELREGGLLHRLFG